MLVNFNDWALFLAILCWVYAFFASFWNHLFDREMIREGVREEIGYRIGRAVHWRLPREGAFIMLGLGVLAVAVVAILPVWAAPWFLGLESTVVLVIWLIAPPGQRMLVSLAEPENGTDAPVQSERKPLRAVAVFLVFGALPAALLVWGIKVLFA